MPPEILIGGAGLSGAVLARVLAEAGRQVTVRDPRPHVAGNCHTERDAETGVMVHRYGPHIFHTDDARVIAFVTRFAEFGPYAHKVRSTVGGRVYSLPVNLFTINQVFGRAFRPDEARAHIESLVERGDAPPANFEDQALATIGRTLYEAFFKGYTEKQWGVSPRQLPAAILARLPLRFSYDDRYFGHAFQGIPVAGFTAMVESMLDHPGITVELGATVTRDAAGPGVQVFFSGPLDGWFDHGLGRLGYRTLEFETFTARGDWQGCPVMNWGDREVPWTRVTEHKHFTPWERHAGTVVTREYARDCGPDDIPYYPVRLVAEKAMLAEYVARAEAEARAGSRVTFLGRLGSYRYLDMDRCIGEALEVAERFLAEGATPAFVHPPL